MPGPKRRFTDEERSERKKRSARASYRRRVATPEGRNAHRIRVRNTSRLLKTGWTEEEVQAALVEQDGRCALCSRLLDIGGIEPTSLTADHDHLTGQKRGLLCRRCNTLEGMHLSMDMDEEDWARRVKAYRLKYRAKAAGVVSG